MEPCLFTHYNGPSLNLEKFCARAEKDSFFCNLVKKRTCTCLSRISLALVLKERGNNASHTIVKVK